MQEVTLFSPDSFDAQLFIQEAEQYIPRVHFTQCKLEQPPPSPAQFSICIFDKSNRTDFTKIIQVLASRQRKQALFQQTVLVGYNNQTQAVQIQTQEVLLFSQKLGLQYVEVARQNPQSFGILRTALEAQEKFYKRQQSCQVSSSDSIKKVPNDETPNQGNRLPRSKLSLEIPNSSEDTNTPLLYSTDKVACTPQMDNRVDGAQQDLLDKKGLSPFGQINQNIVKPPVPEPTNKSSLKLSLLKTRIASLKPAAACPVPVYSFQEKIQDSEMQKVIGPPGQQLDQVLPGMWRPLWMRCLGRQTHNDDNSQSTQKDSQSASKPAQQQLYHQTSPLQLKILFKTQHDITKFGFVHCNFNDNPVELAEAFCVQFGIDLQKVDYIAKKIKQAMESTGYAAQQSQDFSPVDDQITVGQVKLKFGLREEIISITESDSSESLQQRIMELFGLGADYVGIIGSYCRKIMDYVHLSK